MARDAVLPFAAMLDPMNAPQRVLHVLDDDLLQIFFFRIQADVDGVVRGLVLAVREFLLLLCLRPERALVAPDGSGVRCSSLIN